MFSLHSLPLVLPDDRNVASAVELDGEDAVSRLPQIFGNPVIEHKIESALCLEDEARLTVIGRFSADTRAGVVDEPPFSEHIARGGVECGVRVPSGAARGYHIVDSAVEEYGGRLSRLIDEHRNGKTVYALVVVG